jgi:hypothetical protein
MCCAWPRSCAGPRAVSSLYTSQEEIRSRRRGQEKERTAMLRARHALAPGHEGLLLLEHLAEL